MAATLLDSPTPAAADRRDDKLTLRVASVSYFNARPLITGLEEVPGVSLSRAVPSRLAGLLRDDLADVALLPVIDYQRLDDLQLLPAAGGIGCDGPTLTVRLFSQTPFDHVTRLCCDPDSHTSVALAKILLNRQFGVRPEIAGLFDADGRPGEARLLIGDKVVCEEPAGFEYQLDLGGAWKRLTGLPFVFAVWASRRGAALGDIVDTLASCRERGLADVESLVRQHAVPRGWPAGIAWQYLTEYLKFDIGERQLEAIRTFHQMAAEDGLIDNPPRPLVVA
jgi:chorismate dehydratase